MLKNMKAIVIGTMLLIPHVSYAESSYLLMTAGRSQYKKDHGSENDTALSLAYGFTVEKNINVEVGYIDFGKIKESGVGYLNSIERDAIYISAVGSMPMNATFSVVAKLGMAVNRYENKFISTNNSETEKITRAKPMLGIGLVCDLSKALAGVLEYQYFGKIGEDKIKTSTLTAGIRYGF